MARSQNANASAGTPATPPADTPNAEAATAPAFDWDAMAEPVAMPNKVSTGSMKVDVLTTVPYPIRARAEASLAINVERKEAKASSTAKRARVDYHWDFQAVTDDKMAAAFDKLITKYAKYRPSEGDIPLAGEKSPKGQVTARTGNPGHFRRLESGECIPCNADADGASYGLRYSVRPFEQRGDAARLPGTAG